MVSGIWLEFDRSKISDLALIDKIKKIVKSKYKCYSYEDVENGKQNTFVFKLIDCNQIKNILDKLGMKIDDEEPCDCGCMSTDFERMVFFLDLEFNYGKIVDFINYKYFWIGRNVTMSIEPSDERLVVLRYMLEDLKREFDREGIYSRLNLDDCNPDIFNGYFNDKGENNGRSVLRYRCEKEDDSKARKGR
jgi:hypothetical protein